MTGPSSVAVPTPPPSTGRSPSLRSWGILLAVMFVLTSAVGGSLALESSYLAITLASHIGLALVTFGLSTYGAAFVARPYGASCKASAGLAGLCALGGTVAGTIFLLYGHAGPALYAMEGFAVVGILASIVLVVLGGPSRRSSAALTAG